jgi:hypothetical protein
VPGRHPKDKPPQREHRTRGVTKQCVCRRRKPVSPRAVLNYRTRQRSSRSRCTRRLTPPFLSGSGVQSAKFRLGEFSPRPVPCSAHLIRPPATFSPERRRNLFCGTISRRRLGSAFARLRRDGQHRADWTRSFPFARSTRAFGFAKFLSPFPNWLKSGAPSAQPKTGLPFISCHSCQDFAPLRLGGFISWGVHPMADGRGFHSYC